MIALLSVTSLVIGGFLRIAVSDYFHGDVALPNNVSRPDVHQVHNRSIISAAPLHATPKYSTAASITPSGTPGVAEPVI